MSEYREIPSNTDNMMSSKFRPRNSAGRLWLTKSPYHIVGSCLQQSPLAAVGLFKFSLNGSTLGHGK
jgi:hypothetical protein